MGGFYFRRALRARGLESQMILSLATLALVVAAGLTAREIARILTHSAAGTASGRALRTCFAVGLTLALVSFAATVRLVASPPGRASDLFWNLLATATLVGAAWYLRKVGSTTPILPPVGPRASPWLAAIFIAGAALFFVLALEHVVKTPDGGWDAWAIWNYRARLLFRSQGDLSAGARGYGPEVLLNLNPQIVYPLFLPTLIYQAWLMLGREVARVPALLAGLFAALTTAALGFGLARLRGPTFGFVAALLLLGTPAFLTNTWFQIADVPLAAFAILALVAACLASRRRPSTDAR